MTFLALLSLLLSLFTVYGCPSSQLISSVVSFNKVVIEQPFPSPYAGMNVFTGVKMQKQGMCDQSPPRNCTIPTTKCHCLPFSQYLLFNLIPTNSIEILTAANITAALEEANTITFIGSFRPSPLIPNILCSYNVSNWTHSFSCLPKFCKDSTTPCIHSSPKCICIAQPCTLYIAIPVE